MTSWVRLWEDMPNDPKWRVVAKRAKRPVSEVIAVFVHMMTNAGASKDRGTLSNWNDEDVATAIDAKPEHVTAIREAMDGKTLDGHHLTGWENRQPLREDGAAERAKAWRERKKLEANGDDQPPTPPEQGERARTQPNATERQKRREKIREDTTTPHSGASARADDQEPAVLIEPRRDSDQVTDGTTRDLLDAVEAGGGSFRLGSAPALFDLSPIRGLIEAGYDFRAEILPTIRSRSRGREVRSWAYFVEAVHQSRITRLEAAKPRARAGPNGAASTPPGLDLSSNPALAACLRIMDE